MSGRRPPVQDLDMPQDVEDRNALVSSADQLQRAARALEQHARAREAVPGFPVTIGHLQEALDQLARGMGCMAQAVVDWCRDQDPNVDEDSLPPNAFALRWHLHAAAQALRASETACASSREWSRRLLDDELTARD